MTISFGKTFRWMWTTARNKGTAGIGTSKGTTTDTRITITTKCLTLVKQTQTDTMTTACHRIPITTVIVYLE